MLGEGRGGEEGREGDKGREGEEGREDKMSLGQLSFMDMPVANGRS